MTWFKRLMDALARGVGDLSPSCRQATRLQSEALEHNLPLRKRIGLWIHLVLCRWCRRYSRHVSFLHTAGKRCSEDEVLPPQALSSAARERIREALKRGQDPP